MDAEISKVAARQNGNITRKQLLAIGFNDRAIQHRVRTGRLYRVYPGVYAVGRPPVTPIECASAAVLACGETAALSHGSAMTLWGFWKHWDSPFEVSVTRDRRPRGIRVNRSTRLTRQDLTKQLGLPVTTPARTLLDIAPRLTDRQLTRAVNDARLSRYLNMSHLADLLERHPHHRSARRLRPFVERQGGPTRSQFEDAFQAFCERFGLPCPVMNTHVAGYEVDALFESEKVIVELDGYDFHSGRRSFESDRDRDADTLEAGCATVRITWQRMTRTAAREAARLHAILAARRG